MTEWNLHDNFVRSLLKTLDASPDNETMEHQQLGTRLTYATLELQFSDMLFKWLEGFMNRLRESIAVLEAPIMAPEECNVGPIVAKACESRKFLEDVQILGQRHSVNYMSLWIHKKRIVAEVNDELIVLGTALADTMISSRSVCKIPRKGEK